MADEPTTDEERQPPPPRPDPPPPSTGQPVGRPPLRRSRSDRVVAGVCGGVGDYFAVDPVLVRIGFVVLALFGGSGLLLYLIAWLVIAIEGDEESAAVRALRGREQHSGRGIVAVGLLIAGVLLVGGPFVWASGRILGGGLVFPMLLMAAGVALLVWPEPREPREPLEPRPVGNGLRDDLLSARDDATRAFGDVRDELSDAWYGSAAAGEPSEPPFAPPPPPAPPAPAPVPAPRPPRPRPFIGPLTLAVLLLFTGGAVALDQADVVDLDPAVGLAIALTIIGVALTVTALVGRARGLIVLGVLLLPVVWWFHAIDLTWWEGIGGERIVVEDLDELEDEYRYGIGQMIVDLSDLDLDGETRELAVGLTIGELVVCVPDGLEVVIDAEGRIGEIRVEGPVELVDNGFDPSLDARTGDPVGGTLELDFDVGLGSGKVLIDNGPASTPCP